jgi:hypothetical protein
MLSANFFSPQYPYLLLIMTYSKIQFIHEDPTIKKSGPNGFILFRVEEWERAKKESPGITTQEFSTIAGIMWRNLSNEERNKYIVKSEGRKKIRDMKVKKKNNRKKKKNGDHETYSPTALYPLTILDDYIFPSPLLTTNEPQGIDEIINVYDVEYFFGETFFF